MKRQWAWIVILAVALAGFITVGLVRAQGPAVSPPLPAGIGPDDMVASQIPVQGQLTDAGGTPLNGTVDVTLTLYAGETGGPVVCQDTQSVAVANGLFNTTISCISLAINGQQLWLGVQVGTDAEMTPRQPIYPVPYALTLRPGAVISMTNDIFPTLWLFNYGGGNALYAHSGAGTAVYAESNDLNAAAIEGAGLYAGVRGTSNSLTGYGGYFQNNTGTALKADGTGIIQSSAPSYLWISGNGVRPWQHDDTTEIDMDTVGGAIISPGSVVGPKNVMLPIAVTGPLYGQDVTLSGLDIDWAGSSGFDGITAILLRRQTGVCSSAACYVTILYDPTDQVCAIGENPEGCRLHFDLTTNNVLTADSGPLYLTIEVNFGGTTGWVELGGVRLTLLHE